MKTHIKINSELLEAARQSGNFETNRETVETALKKFILLKQQEKIRRYKGKLNWDGDLETMRRD